MRPVRRLGTDAILSWDLEPLPSVRVDPVVDLNLRVPRGPAEDRGDLGDILPPRVRQEGVRDRVVVRIIPLIGHRSIGD